MAVDRQKLALQLRALTQRGVYLGTSSWKYPGWFGSIYERDRYVWRGRFSEARFEKNCLREFAETFPAVSVDASYYQFFTRDAFAELAAQVPSHFQFAFKVCADITLKHFPRLPRFAKRGGSANPHFLDADLFKLATLKPCEDIRPHVGLLMFEFAQFGLRDFERGAAFVDALDQFFSQLPRGWPYGVEIRNRAWLRPEYFAVLARHGVTHIYNAWEDMPPLGEQIALPDSQPNPALLATRLLLREGRNFDQAVKRFSPYESVQDPNPEGRAAAVRLARRAMKAKTKAFILAGNRFEGHSPGTISAIADELEKD
jgi:uncharacterized protein YecE (DUF72 family)